MRLKELRKRCNFTLKELSEKTGINLVQLSDYERGKLKLENMTLKNAVKLAVALDCRPEDFLDIKI